MKEKSCLVGKQTINKAGRCATAIITKASHCATAIITKEKSRPVGKQTTTNITDSPEANEQNQTFLDIDQKWVLRLSNTELVLVCTITV
jgi:hypothetical protein